MGFDFFSIMSILFPLFFIFTLSFIGYQIFKGLREWSRNNHSPKIVTGARVVAKRTKVASQTSSHATGDVGNTFNTMHHTHYYVTFQLEDNERIEFYLKSGADYGLIAEQDLGTLSYQGTRFLGFERRL